MSSSVRVAGIVCLAVGIGLCAVSFTVHNNNTGWYSRLGLLLFIVGGVVLRHGVRDRHKFVASDINSAQKRYLLILLRRSPAGLNAQTLEAKARSALEDRFGRNPDGSDYVESGEAGLGFIIQAHGNALMVLETPKGVRNLKPPVCIRPPSATTIWSDHSYELSVGLVYNYDTETKRLSGFVGSLSAVLMDEDTLGVLHPDSGQLWRADQDTIARLTAAPEVFFSKQVT
jgi:hypothetical protein